MAKITGERIASNTQQMCYIYFAERPRTGLMNTRTATRTRLSCQLQRNKAVNLNGGDTLPNFNFVRSLGRFSVLISAICDTI